MRGPHRWQSPFAVPVGKLGEARGPTLEIARMAKKLRDDFKAGAVKLRADAKAAPALAVLPTMTWRPTLEAPCSGATGSVLGYRPHPGFDSLDDDVSF